MLAAACRRGAVMPAVGRRYRVDRHLARRAGAAPSQPAPSRPLRLGFDWWPVGDWLGCSRGDRWRLWCRAGRAGKRVVLTVHVSAGCPFRTAMAAGSRLGWERVGRHVARPQRHIWRWLASKSLVVAMANCARGLRGRAAVAPALPVHVPGGVAGLRGARVWLVGWVSRARPPAWVTVARMCPH